MIQTTHAITAGLAALTMICPPTVPEPTQLDHPNTPCEPVYRAVLMTMWDSSTLPCNPDGRQILVTTIDDDPGTIQEQNCNDAGGQVLYLPATDTFLCIDIDY